MSTSLVHDFDWIARQTPAAPALSWHGGVWTYADLQRAVGATQGRLRASGIQPGSRIALLIRNSPQYVASYFGTIAAGCVAVDGGVAGGVGGVIPTGGTPGAPPPLGDNGSAPAGGAPAGGSGFGSAAAPPIVAGGPVSDMLLWVPM